MVVQELNSIFSELLSINGDFNLELVLAHLDLGAHIWNLQTKFLGVLEDWLDHLGGSILMRNLNFEVLVVHESVTVNQNLHASTFSHGHGFLSLFIGDFLFFFGQFLEGFFISALRRGGFGFLLDPSGFLLFRSQRGSRVNRDVSKSLHGAIDVTEL